jgi:dUTP pyrophosphatase
VDSIRVLRLSDFPYDHNEFNESRVGSAITLHAAMVDKSAMVLEPGARVAVPTGIALELPDLWEAQVHSLEAICVKHGVCVLNSPGTIDSDYRGEVMAILINHGDLRFEINRGLPIAKLKFARYARVEIAEVNKINDTKRLNNGLGSTGTY